ncbi:hypothetical protein AB5I41_25860 [Sphingomonas sp. MMS24-JH45]
MRPSAASSNSARPIPSSPTSRSTARARRGLLVTKTASVREASPETRPVSRHRRQNRGTLAARGMQYADILPRGLRYRLGSERGVAAPEIARDGRTLAFAAPEIAAGAALIDQLRRFRDARRTAGRGGQPRPRLWQRRRHRERGRRLGPAAPAADDRRLRHRPRDRGRVRRSARRAQGRRGQGIRILLEDGTWVVTDRDEPYRGCPSRAPCRPARPYHDFEQP